MCAEIMEELCKKLIKYLEHLMLWVFLVGNLFAETLDVQRLKMVHLFSAPVGLCRMILFITWQVFSTFKKAQYKMHWGALLEDATF